MRLDQIYEKAIHYGRAVDPRKKRALDSYLLKKKKEFEELTGAQRKFYDREHLRHPYADTRILFGDPATQIRAMMVGIDIDVAEILLADRLNRQGENIDVVMSHHPAGKAYAAFHSVMAVHQDILVRLGVSKEVVEELLKERMAEVARRVFAANHTRPVDAARLVGMPFMCVHTPADNHVVWFLDRLFRARAPRRVADLISIISEIPEYRDAIRQNAGPRILTGEKKNKVGKIFVDMTGGTEGPQKIFPRLHQAGVGTIVAMHLSEEHFKSAKTEHLNIVLAGHIASDNIGLNLLLDKIIGDEAIRIVPCSGFVRVSRKAR